MAKTCEYVAFSDYDWTILPLFTGKRGTCHGVSLTWNWTVISLFVAMHAVAAWVTLGIFFQALVTFKSWRTWYFWSTLGTASGIIMYVLVLDILWFTTFGNMLLLGSVFYYLSGALINLGFLLVLWSRLHLILDRPRTLKALLFLILGIGVPLQIILIVGATGLPQRKTHHLGEAFWHKAVLMDPIYVFCEIIMTVLYIWLFARFWRRGSELADTHVRRTLALMIVAEGLAIAGDVTIIALWYQKLYLTKMALSPLVYALKLKIEFMVLNRLTSMTKRRVELRHITISNVAEDASAPAWKHAPNIEDLSTNRVHGLGDIHVENGDSVTPSTTDLDGFHLPKGGTTAVNHDIEKGQVDEMDAMDRQYLGRF